MWRYVAGAVAALLLAGAGVLIFGARARPDPVLPAAPSATLQAATAPEPLPDTVPEASAKTREQKRFDRYDKDRDGSVTRVEYLQSRRKAFAKLDANGDGTLSFDEWAAKTEGKFAGADADHNGSLTRPEFATTAVKRRAGPRRAPCPPANQVPAVRESGEDEG